MLKFFPLPPQSRSRYAAATGRGSWAETDDRPISRSTNRNGTRSGHPHPRSLGAWPTHGVPRGGVKGLRSRACVCFERRRPTYNTGIRLWLAAGLQPHDHHTFLQGGHHAERAVNKQRRGPTTRSYRRQPGYSNAGMCTPGMGRPRLISLFASCTMLVHPPTNSNDGGEGGAATTCTTRFSLLPATHGGSLRTA